MTEHEITEFREQLNIAVLDPNHTGIKQMVIKDRIIKFEPIVMYNMGFGIAEKNGELLLYKHLKHKIKLLIDAGCRDDTYFLTEPNTEYHLFEPDSKNYKQLQENLKSVESNITVHTNECGLGQADETLGFFDSQGGNGTFVASDNKQPDNLIKVIRLDSYTKKHNITHIDFLKIDVEGFELMVLKGAGDMLYNTDYVQFEYGSTFQKMNQSIHDVTNLLSNYGFKHFFTIATNGLAMVPLTDHYMMCNILASKNVQDISGIINQPTLYCKYT